MVRDESSGYQKYTSRSKGINKHSNIGISDADDGTQAPAKVKQFYTAHSVRRGLEYMSIDYVCLGLEIPDWAREILREA